MALVEQSPTQDDSRFNVVVLSALQDQDGVQIVKIVEWWRGGKRGVTLLDLAAG